MINKWVKTRASLLTTQVIDQGHRINSSCFFPKIDCFQAFKGILGKLTFYFGNYDLNIIKI